VKTKLNGFIVFPNQSAMLGGASWVRYDSATAAVRFAGKDTIIPLGECAAILNDSFALANLASQYINRAEA